MIRRSIPADPADVEQLVTDHLIAEPTIGVDDLVAISRREFPLRDAGEVTAVVERLWSRARGLGRVHELLELPGVTEVMINGPGAVWIDRDGAVEPTELVLEHDDIVVLVERMLQPLGLRVDPLSPCVDARLADGSRVNVAVLPVAVDGPVVTIRRFLSHGLSLDSFGSPMAAALLRRLVQAGATVLVVGGTGAGKTSLLNALGAEVPARTRIVTIEDTAELQLPGDHVVRLEARPPGREGSGEITIRQLVRNALRMRPDRLIVGEVRGGEAFDLLLALNTGHAGSFTTVHANDPIAGLFRLETLALLAGVELPFEAVRRQMLAAIDVVVHVERDGAGRRVRSVSEVDPDRLAVRELWPSCGEPPVRAAVRSGVEVGS